MFLPKGRHFKSGPTGRTHQVGGSHGATWIFSTRNSLELQGEIVCLRM